MAMYTSYTLSIKNLNLLRRLLPTCIHIMQRNASTYFPFKCKYNSHLMVSNDSSHLTKCGSIARQMQHSCGFVTYSKVREIKLYSIWTRLLHSDVPELPLLDEEELEEQLTKGHGPGGQKVNKTTNCVILKHLPTNIFVKVHESRSLEKNRELARLRLREKLDLHWNGENSILMVEKKEKSLQKQLKKRKTKERLALKKAFKEREGLS